MARTTLFTFSLLLTILLGLLLTLSPAVSQPTLEALPKIRAGTPPHSVLGNIMGSNRQFMQGIKATDPGRQLTQAPHLIWLADPDPRISPEMVWERKAGGIYTVRNLANQLEPAAAAIDYGVRSLHGTILLITGNTDNQAIAQFNEGYEHLGTAIRRELNQLHPPLARLLATTGKSAEEMQKLLVRQVESNVDYQVSRALERYRDRVDSGRLVVAGGVIDLANHYGGGPGRLYLINLNGETEPGKIRQSSHVVRVPPEMRDYLGRRSAR
ncbi:carbonic anhydrase [Desulfurivibrio alkaliphilus]|uniref:Carbonic anhydrase n=1 Tax=Desulfurivibrio alkaliphilus (strain DSM 19089 / UNIQEM U267 / AHT2) TaxID=589865 RepID=D6Z5B3_DESAT|nr:carbonic anhydrase [Desulfurivibrio alkaliphilus]ADH84770.1 carbonic anhydrase [Desulfurivibrio alkaliphilus AHT 2]